MWMSLLTDNGLTISIMNALGDLVYSHPATAYEIQKVQATVAWVNDNFARAMLMEGKQHEPLRSVA